MRAAADVDEMESLQLTPTKDVVRLAYRELAQAMLKENGDAGVGASDTAGEDDDPTGLKDAVLRGARLISEANAIARHLEQDLKFEVMMPSFFRPCASPQLLAALPMAPASGPRLRCYWCLSL